MRDAGVVRWGVMMVALAGIACAGRADTPGAATASAEDKEIARLIGQLGSEDFAVRAAASAQLATMGLAAYRATSAARRTATDPEIQVRLEQLEATLSKHIFWDGTESVAEYARRVGVKEAQRTVTLGDAKAPLTLALVPAGEFLMGSPAEEAGHKSDEMQHPVRIDHWIFMGTTAVTQAQWKAVMGANPSGFKGEDRPVEMVSWKDAMEFCAILTRTLGGGGDTYRLPTEAEWEFACRAGTTTAYNCGPGIDVTRANYMAKAVFNGGAPPEFRATTIPVGTFKPNAWGLYDMHGNVWQWCLDWYGDYPAGTATSPTGPADGQFRVVRGGSWCDEPSWCRSAARAWGTTDRRTMHIGLRVVMRSSLGMPAESDPVKMPAGSHPG